MADPADNASSSSGSAAQPNPQPLSNALQRLTLSKAEKKLIKERYAFWETQPVRQFTDTSDVSSSRTLQQADSATACLDLNSCPTFAARGWPH
jgi:hypothetical protein